MDVGRAPRPMLLAVSYTFDENSHEHCWGAFLQLEEGRDRSGLPGISSRVLADRGLVIRGRQLIAGRAAHRRAEGGVPRARKNVVFIYDLEKNVFYTEDGLAQAQNALCSRSHNLIWRKLLLAC